jgi:lactate dehydrogenase-like 2-hydroxyacid dehydrogenase
MQRHSGRCRLSSQFRGHRLEGHSPITGKIGQIAAKILNGFGPSKLLGYDPYPNEGMKQMGMEYTDLDSLLAQSDIISLHLPLMPQTYHMIGKESIAKMKDGVVIINVSRGGLIGPAAPCSLWLRRPGSAIPLMQED